ncbi:MAG: hypothetical protein KBT66_00650 [Amphritea sp.]|nr:hypothetical protein [Amphritea sp.]
MNRFIVNSCIFVLILTGCANPEKAALPVYEGSGGMTKWNILPEAYLFHYETGFTGIDALGYDEQLQKNWSRLGAAKTCGIPFDKRLIIPKLISQYGENAITHELNGIGFHSVQSRKVPQFCDTQRVEAISKSVNRYLKGYFD